MNAPNTRQRTLSQIPLESLQEVSAQQSARITLIVGDLSSAGAGRWGGGVRPFLLAQALMQLGFGVEMIGFSDEFPGQFHSPCPIQTLPKGPYPQFLRSAQALLSQVKGNVIYAYKLKPSSFGIALLSQLWRSIMPTRQNATPVILDIDDWEMSWLGGDEWRYRPTLTQLGRDLLKPTGALRQPDHPFYLRWLEHLVARADAVTTHTEFLRSRFGGTLIPNGKDTQLFNPTRYDTATAKRQFGLADYRVIMFPGAPRPYKGLEDVLLALETLNQPDLRLAIVGGSPYDNYDEQLRQRWGRWIVQLPVQPYEHMPAAIAAADVIVVPQRDEPAARAQFPLKLTDGMAMAKPVLATIVGDIPKILGDTGYLVSPQSPTDLAEALQQIFSHPEEARLKGLAARERCVVHYSLNAMATQLLPVFTPYLGNTPSQ